MASNIDWLREHVEAERTEFHVPGVAVGAVIDGEIVLAEGFGQRDIDNDLPVTPETLFAFGSSTKSLTALLVAMYVEDGLLEWEKPVRDYIPGFRMHDPVASEQLTVRDTLCHSSGLPRHEFAWITNQRQSRAELVAKVAHLPAHRPFRRAWNYNNIMYTTAGYLVELVSGKTWEEATRERILDPLGMTTANFHVEDSKRSADFARGYGRKEEETVELPMRVMGVAGPAGSLNLSLNDALRWLQFNLDPNQTLVPQSVLDNVRNNHMHMPMSGLTGLKPEWDETFSVGYGLGWFIDSYRGLRVLHHGGNVDGFSAMTSMVPSKRAGMVVLTNLNGTALNMLLPYRLYDEVVGLEPVPWTQRMKEMRASRAAKKEDEEEDGGDKAAESENGKQPAATEDAVEAPGGRPLEDYLGTYEHPGYGKVTVRLNADETAVECALNDVELSMTRTKWDVFTTAPITPLPPGSGIFTMIFAADATGDIASMGMTVEMSLPPIEFERASDKVADEVLQTLPGKYVSPLATIEVIHKDGKLFGQLPGQPELELVPRRGLTFEIAGAPGQTLEFVLSEDGTHAVKVVHPAATFEREDTESVATPELVTP
ncbi:MAG TPA: serine hydrolase [Acidimicrobiales bacterium]|nr:serine hydrolase [Acidimicrobiales bacterium]